MRAIRTRNKQSKSEKVKGRTPSELTERITTSSEPVSTIAADLSDGELKSLIDHAYQMQETAKALNETVGQIKDVLKSWATSNEVKELDGLSSGAMKISAKTTTTTKGATALVRLLKKFNKVDAADAILKVTVTKAKQYIGEQVLKEEKFLTVDSDEYGMCTLKEKKRKKKK